MRYAISARQCLLSKTNYKNIVLEMKVPLTFVLILGPDDKSGINQSCKPPSSFKCEECGSKFTAAVSLKRHKERVHDKSNHKGRHVCTHCSKAFHDKQDWSRHEKTHTSVKSGQSLKLCFVNERTELLNINFLAQLLAKKMKQL